MHLVKKDGKLIAMKGNIDEEITEDVRKRIDKKYKLIKINKFYLPKEESHRSLVIIGKKGL